VARGPRVVEAPADSRILASLYAQLEGYDPAQPRPSVAFAEPED
jgi:hypothetical protein